MTKDASRFKHEISELYLTEDRPLAEVRRIIKEKYDFDASTSWYRQKLRDWGFMKNSRLPGGDDGFVHSSLSSSSSTDHNVQSFRKRPLSLLSSADSGYGVASRFSSRVNASSASEVDWSTAATIEQILGTNVDTEKTPQSPPGNLAPVIRRLRSANQESVSPQKKEIDGMTDLHRAVEIGDMDLIRKLVQMGPDVNVRDSHGRSPLYIVLCQNPIQDDIVEMLLDNGADPNVLNTVGDSPFHLLLERAETVDHDSLVLMCLEHGADPHIPNSHGHLPLELYIEPWWVRLRKDPVSQTEKRIWLGLLEVFFEKGASPDVKLASGQYLCHSLIRIGIFEDSSAPGPNKAPFGILLCQWSNPTLRGMNGNTALHQVLECELNNASIRALQILLDRGADPNATNDEGHTPLLLLFSTLRNGIVDPFMKMASDLLMKAGANPLQPGLSEQIPVEVAAAPEFAEDRYSLLRAMMTCIGDSSHEISDEERWSFWYEFRRSFQTTSSWRLADHELNNHSSYKRHQVNDVIRKSARIVLAERTLKNLEKSVLGAMDAEGLREEARESGAEIVNILRTCRSEEIEIDPKWYQLLLDLIE